MKKLLIDREDADYKKFNLTIEKKIWQKKTNNMSTQKADF